MYCPNCGCENSDDAKFCRDCGETLESPDTPQKTAKNENHKKIIIGLIIVIAVIIVVGAIYISANPVGDDSLKLKEYDFGNFTMQVPQDASYNEYDSVGKGTKYWAIGYSSGESELFMVWISNYETASKTYDFIEQDGDLAVYQMLYNGTYLIQRHIGGYYIEISGQCDLEDLKVMANSIKVTNPVEDTPASSSSTQTSSPSTPSSMSILGGSFSTGSADEDKTYARINVGTSHAGEDVIVQIWYSRDGNTLNNGNMVPATVHSDGYLEIASADAYKYYPDYATINIYDSNSRLLATQSVSLSPSAGTQTF